MAIITNVPTSTTDLAIHGFIANTVLFSSCGCRVSKVSVRLTSAHHLRGAAQNTELSGKRVQVPGTKWAVAAPRHVHALEAATDARTRLPHHPGATTGRL